MLGDRLRATASYGAGRPLTSAAFTTRAGRVRLSPAPLLVSPRQPIDWSQAGRGRRPALGRLILHLQAGHRPQVLASDSRTAPSPSPGCPGEVAAALPALHR